MSDSDHVDSEIIQRFRTALAKYPWHTHPMLLEDGMYAVNRAVAEAARRMDRVHAEAFVDTLQTKLVEDGRLTTRWWGYSSPWYCAGA